MGVSKPKPSETGRAFSLLFYVSGWRDLGSCACESYKREIYSSRPVDPNLSSIYGKLEPHHYFEIFDIKKVLFD